MKQKQVIIEKKKARDLKETINTYLQLKWSYPLKKNVLSLIFNQ